MTDQRREGAALRAKICVLFASIAITFALNVAIDGDYIDRRIHVYRSAYLGVFYFALFLMLAVYLYLKKIRAAMSWTCLLYGMGFGCMAGVIAYFLSITLDVFGVKNNKLLPDQMLLELVFQSFTFPLLVLRSWLYGLIAGLMLFQGWKIVQRILIHGPDRT
ncbi:hypothetical protein D3870_03985 [Noviherbaspirillum cavernae]|uniref:Uncharacterized protein n=1 Tax=Noviherbaspirillum cavernae TaxID=2320862 RepID=A0A418WYG4_9BURK|nr:hypothetical protein [Noviherbaspirillum cavernae]RJG05288.1 hypothetical protein D3870_03985 [Noviherbaspirillum cavernae]